MIVTVEIYKVAASGEIEIESKTVKEAKDKALLMAKSHVVPMSEPEPDNEFIVAIKKAVCSFLD
jgi:hypothetical protein